MPANALSGFRVIVFETRIKMSIAGPRLCRGSPRDEVKEEGASPSRVPTSDLSAFLAPKRSSLARSEFPNRFNRPTIRA